MSGRSSWNARIAVFAAVLALLRLACPEAFGAPATRVALAGHHVPLAISTARLLRRVEPNRTIRLTFVLPLRDPQGRADLLQRLYDPADPMYRHFMTARQFADRFAPSIDSVHAVSNYALSQGLSIDEISANYMVLVAHGPAASVENAFQVQLHDYAARDGTRFRAPDREPTVPVGYARQLLTVRGFDDLPAASSDLHRAPPPFDRMMGLTDLDVNPYVSGTGPLGYLAPSDVKSAYSLNAVPETGSGQTLGLFELDGYTASDITQYESEFYPGHSSVGLQNVLVDGYDGRPQTTSGASEVTLDIDMMIALAPGLGKILVYEGDNTTSGLIAAYNRIASDDVATVVSSSWGLPEITADYYGQISPEGQAFEEMALQGQTMLAASGDSGGYADSSTLSVQDPASQPYVTGVGGTDLTLVHGQQTITYGGEHAWGDASDTYGLRPRGQGGGGGVSELQPLPSFQRGVTGSYVSATRRNVPDVSFYGDYDTGGYAIYFTDPADPTAGGQWEGYNGTSAASPLWAGFVALVNQGRAQAARAPIGFLNPAIYTIAKNASAYARDFHDINDGTTNLYYPASSGYDLATGWGSFIGSGLYADLVSSLRAPTVASFSLGSGGAGIGVTVTGAGFTGTTSVTVGGVAAIFAVSSDTRLTLTVPAGAKTGPITVTNAVGSGNSVTSFVVTSGGSPVITSITPPNAQVGSVISILGSGFTGATLVTVGGVSVAFTVVGDGKIIFAVPAGLRGGPVSIATPRGTVESTTRLSISTWSAINVSAVPDGTARILWTRNDGAAGVWSLNSTNQLVATGPTYGPYTGAGSAWAALSVAAAPDGTSRLLWTRGDGAAGIWALNASGVVTQVGLTYGPYSDPTGHWAATNISVAPDGSLRMLWNRSDGAMGLWTLNASGAMTRIGPTYGPYSDGQGSHWTALGVGSVPDGTTRVLWMRNDGAMGLWSFDASDQQLVVGPTYGPYTDSGGDWYPLSLSTSTDGLSHVLWGRSDGAAGAWTMNSGGVATSIGPVYGPYAEFSPFNLSFAAGQSRLLWVENDRAAGLWTLDCGNQKTLIGPTYGPF